MSTLAFALQTISAVFSIADEAGEDEDEIDTSDEMADAGGEHVTSGGGGVGALGVRRFRLLGSGLAAAARGGVKKIRRFVVDMGRTALKS